MNSTSPTKRLDDGVELDDDGVRAYRVYFSCRYTGKVIAKSKRRTTWRFGLCVHYPDGSRHTLPEEHQVELIWSIKSGKTSLLWNNQDISHFFPCTKSKNHPPKVVEFNWQSSSGVTFHIVAHAHEPDDVNKQNELFIGGRSFFSLPSTPEFLAMKRETQYVHVTPDKYPSDGHVAKHGSSDNFDAVVLPSPRVETRQRRPESNGRESGCGEEGGRDDLLTSNVYSNVLDALRNEMSNSVPELEDMLSRAIIYAYSEDYDSLGSSLANDSFSFQTGEELDPTETEANALCEAYEWMKWTFLHERESDIEDLKLEFMRSHVETMVAHARHHRLSPAAAAKIMITVAAVLNLKIVKRVPSDKVILVGTMPGVATKDVFNSLIGFGKIASVCTASGENGFAVCQFESDSAATAACNGAKQGQLLPLGSRLEVFNVFAKQFPWCTKRDEGERPARRVPGGSFAPHRRMPLTLSENHILLPEGEGIELYENDDTNEKRYSLTLSEINEGIAQSTSKPIVTPGKINPDLLEFSSSSVSMSPSSVKGSSTGTMSTLSSLEGEDVNFTGTTLILK